MRHSWNSKRGIEGKELWKSPEERGNESDCKSEKALGGRPQNCPDGGGPQVERDLDVGEGMAVILGWQHPDSLAMPPDVF